jgi:oligoendopeptidase F
MSAMTTVDHDADGAAEADALPRWDLTPLFPAVGSPEVAAAEAELARGIDALAQLYDRHGVRGGATSGTGGDRGGEASESVDVADVAGFEDVLAATNDVRERFSRLETFAYGHVSTDSGDEAAQSLLSRLTNLEARLATLRTRFDAWLGSLDVEGLIAASPAAAEHAWPLRKAARRSAHQMSEPEESLAAELGVTGSTAWGRQ